MDSVTLFLAIFIPVFTVVFVLVTRKMQDREE